MDKGKEEAGNKRRKDKEGVEVRRGGGEEKRQSWRWKGGRESEGKKGRRKEEQISLASRQISSFGFPEIFLTWGYKT